MADVGAVEGATGTPRQGPAGQVTAAPCRGGVRTMPDKQLDAFDEALAKYVAQAILMAVATGTCQQV